MILDWIKFKHLHQHQWRWLLLCTILARILYAKSLIIVRKCLSRVREVCGQLHGCDDLEVEVSSHGHHGVARFRPSFMDVAGTVVRIADRARRHVVHADVSDPGFMLAPGRRAIRLSIAGA